VIQTATSRQREAGLVLLYESAPAPPPRRPDLDLGQQSYAGQLRDFLFDQLEILTRRPPCTSSISTAC
jgi:hypothetical protein